MAQGGRANLPTHGNFITFGLGSTVVDLLRQGYFSGSQATISGNLITFGLGSTIPDLLRQGYVPGPSQIIPPTSLVENVIVQGMGGPVHDMLLQGYKGLSTTIFASAGMKLGGGGFQVGGIPETFLAALVAAIRGSSDLAVSIGSPARIYTNWPGAKVKLPFVKIDDYTEEQPGEAVEHNQIRLTLGIYGNSLTTVRTCGEAVQNFIDSRNQNNTSTRQPLVWADGIEQGCNRQPTLPPQRLAKTMYGVDFFCWELDYEFDFDPEFQH
jgi:hypothetical protein